ncbi:MAG: hypothetical protein M1833_006870 [Piccolia ochrophora]|nr:MAG: hypothetical protein M1833_006870 [Piccolia ochrophora]
MHRVAIASKKGYQFSISAPALSCRQRVNSSRMTTAAAVSKDDLRIPLIDFSLYLQGSLSQKQAASQSILEGFRTAGFVYLTNYGIPTSTVQEIFSFSSRFFTRPQEQKDDLTWTSPESNRGYSAPGREKVTNLADKDAVEALRSQTPDLKESFEIGRDDEDGYPNNWPDRFDQEGERFKVSMNEFFGTCKSVHMQVMRALALGLGVEESFFDEYTDGGDNTLRLLHYPAVDKNIFVANQGQVRAGEHTDYGSITLLFQDDRGGLQVKSPKGTFVNATPIPNTIVVNAGDLLQRWANDTIKSTGHRVVEPPIPPTSNEYPARYSIAYFCNPNFEKFIDAIPGTYGNEGKKYAGVNSGEYIVKRLGETYE